MTEQILEGKKNLTYNRIIKAATQDFGEKGFAGARMDKIAARAGVNKATLYYQIGDKKALYSEVLHNIFGSVADQLSQSNQSAQSPEENLSQYVTTIINTLRENPLFPAIMMHEAASGGKYLPLLAIKDIARIFEALSGILAHGYKSGHFRKVNPIVLHLTTLGPLLLFAQMKKVLYKHADNLEVVNNKLEFPENFAETVLENVHNLVKQR
ncbi:MAG: TetR/AcrR family transcriptional regulator [Desulfobacteraceae bacterium]|jgi:AcrR family transcriptional regulator